MTQGQCTEGCLGVQRGEAGGEEWLWEDFLPIGGGSVVRDLDDLSVCFPASKNRSKDVLSFLNFRNSPWDLIPLFRC